MNVLLYTEGMKIVAHSGVGRAIKHQMKALELNDINYTTDLSSKNYDLVHINTVGPMSCHIAKRARRNGHKVIMHAHSTEEDFRDSFFFANAAAPAFKKWLIHAYGMADSLITPTPYSKSIIDSYNIGIPCQAVSNGVDLDKFQYNKEKADAFRNEYHFQTSDKIVLSVGLQIKRKGILDFIKLASQLPQYQFIWCGHTNSTLQTKDVRLALKNPPSNVHFLGYVNNMIGAYSVADIFFMPTYEETEGIVVLEALAMKKPVILRDIPVYENWLLHGEHCFKGKTNEEFKKIIIGLFNNTFEDTTENGYKVVEERTLNQIGQTLASIYNQLLSK